MKVVKSKFKMVINFIELKEIKKNLLFLIILSITTINIEEFLVYYDEVVYHISASFEGYNTTGLFVVSILLLFIYNWRLSNKFELVHFVCFVTIFRILSAYLFAMQVSSVVSTTKSVKFLLIFQSLLLKSVIEAYLYTPATVYFSKMVPHEIEATLMGLVYSIVKFNSEVVGRFWGVLLN